MSAGLDIGFGKILKNKADTVIVGVFAGKRLTVAAKKLDDEIDGLLKHHLDKHNRFTGKPGQVMAVSAPQGSAWNRLILIGMGEPAKLDAKACETSGGKLYIALKAAAARRAAFFIEEEPKAAGFKLAAQAAHMAAGARLRAYRFE